MVESGTMPARPASLGERLKRLSRTVGDCRLWTGCITRGGYGAIKVAGKKMGAHRAAYAEAHGEIPDGMLIDHICDNRHCIAPGHLRLATNKQNQENRRVKPRSGSGLRNVYEMDGRFYVRVRHNRELHSGGSFVSAEDAARAAVQLRNELFTHNTLDRLEVRMCEQPWWRDFSAVSVMAGLPPVDEEEKANEQ